jgi:5-hydroxyisourate hydrolase-like protein (transthyretin family)
VPSISHLLIIVIYCILLSWSGSLSAQTLTGRVNNGTTGKPAAEDRVELVNLSQGMKEVAHTRTNVNGRFSFQLPEAGPHLVRAIHQGVTYYRMAPPGINSVEVHVFDVSPSTANVSVTADVMRFQAKDDELQGIRLFAVINTSNPPRTRMYGQDFEFFLPDGAEIDQGMAKTNGGQPVNAPPVPEKDKNRYGFSFPIRPGETEFQVVFHMKYSGELNVDPKALHGAEHFVVMVPKTMQFTAVPGLTFQSMEDPRQSDALVRVVANIRAGQPLNFRISGTGTLDEPGDDSRGEPHPVPDQTAPSAGTTPAGPDSHSNSAPYPLKRYGRYIAGGFALLLAAGIIYARTRSRSVARPSPSERHVLDQASPTPASSSRSDVLLEELKNQLFQLEVERKQGRIAKPEYEQARAVLDRTLKRAIKRGPRT